MSDQLTSLREALKCFVESSETQSQEHIRPLHRHIAERLVIEGGFSPDDVAPRPPLRIEVKGAGRGSRRLLVYDPELGEFGDQIVLGGLKTKQVDVVVSKKGIGPCLAVSVKGSLNAFRNFTNRMEEAAGDCTNIHMVYPALVYGFLHALRGNRESEGATKNDVAIHVSGEIASGIMRYHEVMCRLAGRMDMREDASKYEAVAVLVAETLANERGQVVTSFPPAGSPLGFHAFFSKLYEIYDLRFVYSAPALESRTRRSEWAPDSPVLAMADDAGFTARVVSSD